MSEISAITWRLRKALPELGGQHVIGTFVPGVGDVAFEFRWTDGKRYKVVVSDAETVGVENMVYPPPAESEDDD